jgi:hypothetical protein
MSIFMVCRAVGGRNERNNLAVLALGENGLKTVETSVIYLVIIFAAGYCCDLVRPLEIINRLSIRNLLSTGNCKLLYCKREPVVVYSVPCGATSRKVLLEIKFRNSR